MEDIYDIKNIFLGFPIDLIYSLVFIVFIIILFTFYKFFNPKGEKLIKKPLIVKKEKIDFNLILSNFEEESLMLDSSIFYSRLLDILRDILEDKGNKNISKMTFEEISNLKLDDSLKNMIKSIYYKEYIRKIDDNKDIRLDFIQNIKRIIK